MTTKKARIREARERLKTATDQAEQAAVHSWEPTEPAECVTKSFYSFENALTAAATALGERWTKKHYEKADLARELVAKGKLRTDISPRLVELNDLRKNVQYGEPGRALVEADLEEILNELWDFLAEVQAAIDRVEES